MKNSLAQRDRQPEFMDQPGLDRDEHARALAGLRRINFISGTSASLLAPIEKLAREKENKPLQILELACGGGDTAIDLALHARRKGLAIKLHACDINPEAIEIAKANSLRRGVELEFFCADALEASDQEKDFDVVFCSLFLHHLNNADAEQLLKIMNKRAWAGTRLLSRSWVVHTDGPLSVKAAFQIEEVRALTQRAGIQNAKLQRCWPERYLLSWEGN